MQFRSSAGLNYTLKSLASSTSLVASAAVAAAPLMNAAGLVATAAFVLFPDPAQSGPGPCVTNGNTLTCSGDQSSGVLEPTDYSSPPVQIFIIDSTTAIIPVAGNSGIDASGDDVGLYDITVRAPNGIFITGDLAAGINAGLATGDPVPPFNGDVIVNSEANITANGTRMQGISAFVGGSGNVTVTSVGDILVNTNLDPQGFGEGINTSVGETGNITVDTTGNITTTNAEGVSAVANVGDIDITSRGNISANGDVQEGIFASTVEGDISIESTGNILTNGSGGHGFFTIFNGNVSIISEGNITLSTGNSAAFTLIPGVEAASGTLATVRSTGDIFANGTDSFGVFGSLDDTMLGQFIFDGNVSAAGSAFRVETGAGNALFDLRGGTFAGGTGAGIDIPAIIGVENATVGIVVHDTATLTASSGTAVVSNAGATTINNSGLIDGSVLLRPGGNNRINNLAGATFAPRSNAIVGAGRFIVNDGTFSPFGLGTLGTTQVTGNLFSNGSATYQVDISDIGSDATSVNGQFTLNGTMDINATTPENTFAVNDFFSIADATGGIFGAFSSVTDNLAGFEFVPLIARDRSELGIVATTNGIFTSGDCSAVGGVVVCSGNQSDGITNRGLMPDFASLTSNQLVVENLTQPVGAPTGEPAVEVFVNNPAGFFADIDTGMQGISTTGQGQRGIEVVNIGGSVSIVSAGGISTRGRDAQGIVGLTTGGGDVSVNSSSNISTTAIDTHAVVAETQNQNGSITISNSGAILTAGALSKGLLASVREVGDITITNSGTINAQDDAIFAAARRGGNITIDNTADLAGGGDASIFAEVGDSGVGNGNITINSVGNLSFSNGQFANGISAGVEGNGDIEITSNGNISANGTFGTGIRGRVGGVGDVTIRSTGDVTSSGTGISASGDNTLVEHSGTIDSGATGIFASGSESVSIISSGSIDATAASFTGAIEANPDGDAALSVNHTGDIRVSLEGIGNTVIGSGILIETGNVFSTQAIDTNVDFTGNIVFAEGLGITDSQNFLDNQRLSAGISMVSISSRNLLVNSTGDITSDNPNVHGIAAIIRSGNSNAFGDIDITSNGDISVTGENADGIRTRGTVGNTSTVTIAGGSVVGGTGDSGSGVEFRGALGAIGILNVNTGTVSALSGVAVRGQDGSETINNAGTITGSVLLGAGMNSFNNLAGGRFNSGMLVDLGGGVLLNSGTIAPGSSIGTTMVNGDFTQTATGLLEIEIAGDGTSDRIDVAGNAALAGNLSVFGLGYPTGFPDAQTYTILTADGGVTGTFDTVMDNLPDVDVTATYLPNAVNIGYIRDGAGPTPPAPPNLSDKSIHANSLEGGFLAGRFFGDMLQTRSHNLQFATGTGDAISSEPLAYATISSATYGFGSVYPASMPGARPVEKASPYAVWIGGLGAYADVDGSAAATGFDQRSRGVAGGFDAAFDAAGGRLIVGVATGYSVSDVDQPLGSADIATLHVGAHASFSHGPLIVSGAAAYGFQDYDIWRTIPMAGMAPAVATSSVDGGVFEAYAEASYDVAPALGIDGMHGMRLAPVISLGHVHADRDAYSETGAGILNLSVAGASFSRTTLGVGIEMAARFETESDVVFTPSLGIRYEHGFGDDRATVSSQIAGVTGATFTDSGAFLGDDSLRLSAGLGIEFNRNFSIDAAYNGSYSSEMTSHGGQITARLKF